MTADNDINAMFEKNTVKEIETLLSKMRNDIERKKEDLRIMVGERYRDLIEAADTISDMRESAESVCKNIQTMEGLCESLQQRGLIGFKTRMSTATDNSRLNTSSHQYSLAIQVKLLVDVPEILWGLTEKKEYLDAAQLLLLAQQAHTALQLSPNANEMLQKFPVISRQWSTISQFRSIIAKGSVAVIKNEVKDCSLVLNAVSALVLMEGASSSESLRRVLSLRRSSLASLLSLRSSSLARTQLVSFVSFFVASFRSVYYVFGAPKGERCRLEKTIASICGDKENEEDKEAPRGLPISLLQESSLGLSFLPKSVVEFRPTLSCSYETLAGPLIEAEMKTWLEALATETSASVAQLLSCTTSIKALSLIRSSFWEAQGAEMGEQEWNKSVEFLLGKEVFCPWDFLVRQEALVRAQHLVTKELGATRESLMLMLQNLLLEIKNNYKVCCAEGDVTDFIWSESSSDIPDQLAWSSLSGRNNNNNNNNTDKMGLFYKSRGYTKRVQGICRAVNSKMAAIIEDASNYAPKCPPDSGPLQCHEISSNERAKQDYNALLRHLEEQTIVVFKGFLDEIQTLGEKHLETQEDAPGEYWGTVGMPQPIPDATAIVTLSRVCQAMPVVCQQLKLCAGASLLANPETARRVSLGVSPDTPPWQVLGGRFSSCSASLMARYVAFLSRLFGALLDEEVAAVVRGGNPQRALTLFPMWDRVRIEEESETGTKMECHISIPAHPSPPLSKALINVCSSLNAVCAPTVARTTQMELVTSLCAEVVRVYGSLAPPQKQANSPQPELNQATSLQLIFDLKLVQNILLPRENKDLNYQVTDLIRKFESRVDPFDLDVFAPHLTSRVRVASQRLLVLLGTLIPRERQPLSAKGPPPAPTPTNTLTLVPSVEIPRFSNVPLPSPTTRKQSLMRNNTVAGPFKSCHDNAPSVVSRDPTSSSMTSSRSVGSSIFSAMSSSWFGGTS